jgi:hypothetical protein
LWFRFQPNRHIPDAYKKSIIKIVVVGTKLTALAYARKDRKREGEERGGGVCVGGGGGGGGKQQRKTAFVVITERREGRGRGRGHKN